MLGASTHLIGPSGTDKRSIAKRRYNLANSRTAALHSPFGKRVMYRAGIVARDGGFPNYDFDARPAPV
jgi:hypothetical protein